MHFPIWDHRPIVCIPVDLYMRRWDEGSAGEPSDPRIWDNGQDSRPSCVLAAALTAFELHERSTEGCIPSPAPFLISISERKVILMADIQKQYGLFIDGAFVPASDGATFAAHNPANGEELALFAEATKEDVDRA